jgi:hypothetical protein
MLMALPLQKLIRHPGVRVENGKLAGISTMLPNLRQGSDANLASAEPALDEGVLPAEPGGLDETAMASGEEADEMTQALPNQNDSHLKETVSKFFMNVNRKNWNSALALMNEDEKRMLLDDKGKLKESAKQRLSQIDQKNRDALVLQDGKLAGVTLLLPME